MNRYTIQIDAEGAAFDGGDGYWVEPNEVARILKRLATDLRDGRAPEHLLDVNGNCCGHLTIETVEEWEV